MSEKVPILVVVGAGIDGKPHASRFAERDAALVTRAAELMGYHAIQVAPDHDELLAIAEELPLGKIFATGRAFVPFVSRAAFDKLSTLVPGGVTIEQRMASIPSVPPPADMFTTEAMTTADALWAKVEVGTVVLVAADPEQYGLSWWEGIVVNVEGDDLTIRWLDDAGLEPFHCARRNVALRHPGAD